MAAGDFFGSAERLAIDTTIRKSEELCRYEFSVYVGDSEGEPRPFATRLHNTLVAPARSILIMIDPRTKVLEIVTGGQVRQVVNDSEIELVVTAMKALFAEGRLADGVKQGITQIAEHLHASESN